MGRMYKFAQITSIFSLSVKIMPPIIAFYCNTIETTVDQSGWRDSRHPATSGTAKFRLTYNEAFLYYVYQKGSSYQLNTKKPFLFNNFKLV